MKDNDSDISWGKFIKDIIIIIVCALIFFQYLVMILSATFDGKIEFVDTKTDYAISWVPLGYYVVAINNSFDNYSDTEEY
jgi:hypothetical protein